MTTNGSQLAKYAQNLYDCGVRRINVSLDTLDPNKFRSITRWGRFEQVMEGLNAAVSARLLVKINCVALKGINDDEFDHLIHWCGDRGFDLTLIEVMPMGDIDNNGDHVRLDQYLPLSMVRADLKKRWTLHPLDVTTGGPARYVEIVQTGRKLGFITPLTHNFCESCNRVRVTCTGQLYMCLGQEDRVDLRKPLRSSNDNTAVIDVIHEGIHHKPKGHDFVIERKKMDHPAVNRYMSVTGG